MSTLPLVLAYLGWEVAVAAVCLAVVVRLRPLAMRVPLFLGLHITVSALSASFFSFAHANTVFSYGALAAVLLVAGAAFSWTRLGSTARHLARLFRADARSLAIWFGLGALLALSIRPLEEGDSLANLHDVMGWVQNLTTPYTFANNYVPFWDLASVPALVLTHCDYFFWVHSLEAVLLLGAAMWLIGRELQMPRGLATWSIAALLLFPHLWLGPTGVSTNKNDMIHAAGYAMLALVAARAARGRAGRSDVLMTALATVFISVKASGPAMMLLAGVVVCAVSHRWIARNLRTALLAAGIVGAIWSAAAGHYYLHNYLAYGNPVYPYQINFGPIHLPGRADLSATSILYSLGDARVWRFLFLPEGGLSPDGLLFPLILPALLLGSIAAAGVDVWKRRVTVTGALAVFQLLSWGLYFRSFYTASGWPGDLAFVRNDLNSTRYVEGPLLVGALWLVWALHRARVPKVLIYLLLAVQGASCFVILLRRAPDKPWVLMALCGLALAAWSLALRKRVVLPAALALVLASLVAGVRLVERRRPLWLQALQPVYQPLYHAPAQDLFYLIDDEFGQQACWHFALLGRRLQHTAHSGSRAALATQRTPPSYIAWVRPSPDTPSLEIAGYFAVVNVPKGMLLRRR